MSYVDTQYIDRVGVRLEKFKHQGRTYNFRCPYCGDSQRYKSKARGYFFMRNNDYVYKCHNCGISKSLSTFLKDQASDLYSEYLLEKYKKPKKKEVLPDLSAKPYFATKPTGLQDVASLNNEHPARQYLEKRRLPAEAFYTLYYVDKFKAWVNSQSPNYFESLKNDQPRIIIPLIDHDGKWFGIQGRSLAPKSVLRYITCIFDKSKTKLFGLDRIKTDEEVYVTEGPFDSYFLPNAIAMCGSDVDYSTFNYQFTFVYDNEPRNKEIVDKIIDTIDKGYSVVIFPKTIKEKDLNDMHLAGHDVKEIVKSNTFKGAEAKVKLTFWKKV